MARGWRHVSPAFRWRSSVTLIVKYRWRLPRGGTGERVGSVLFSFEKKKSNRNIEKLYEFSRNSEKDDLPVMREDECSMNYNCYIKINNCFTINYINYFCIIYTILPLLYRFRIFALYIKMYSLAKFKQYIVNIFFCSIILYYNNSMIIFLIYHHITCPSCGGRFCRCI